MTNSPVFAKNETYDFSRSGRCPVPNVSSYFRCKGYFDRCVAVILLIFALPVIGVLILLTKLTSRGPGIYSQVRVGANGKLFTMYKIRSMSIDAEKRTGAVWSIQGDPRVTWLGKILRKLHLDELPQLINVLRGDMALVGPRPERPEFVSILKKEIDGYSYRLLVVPGVTGFAQLNLPPDEIIDDVRRKIALDFEYIERASWGFDFLLLLATAARLFKGIGMTPLKILGVFRDIENSPWAKHVGAVPVEKQGDHVSLSEIFKQADAERLEKVSSTAGH